MASAPAATRLAPDTQIQTRGRGTVAKLIGGLGAALTVATVAAVILSASSPSSTTAVAPQVATAYAAVAAPVSAAAPIRAPAAISAPAPVSAMAPPALAAAPAAAEEKKECKLLPRRFYVTGTGSVRLHADGFVSRTVALSDIPQEVDLPQRRPTTGEVQQNIVVEGQANFVLLTTDYDFKQGLRVNGTSNFDIYWVPPENC